MHELTQLIRKDMVPALGVTEPGAIAFAVAKARSYASGEPVHLSVAMNSGMYKNAFTCGIPNSEEVGPLFAAALGLAAGDPEKGLESLAGVSPEDNAAARKLIEEGRVSVRLSGITSRIFIRADLETTSDRVSVTIRDKHTNVTKIAVNGKTLLETPDEHEAEASGTEAVQHAIHGYTLAQIVDYIETVPIEEISFVSEAYRVNLELFKEGLDSPRTTFARQLLSLNGGRVISEDEQATASLLCNAAIEARVIGLDKPAMSITGSGAHGIIATMPLYGVCRVNGLGEDKLYRAIFRQALRILRLRDRGRHRHGLRPRLAEGRRRAGDGIRHQQHGFLDHRHDLRRRKPGLHDERHRRLRRGLPLRGVRDAGRTHRKGPRHQRQDAGRNDAQHGPDRFPGHDRYRKDHRGDL